MPTDIPSPDLAYGPVAPLLIVFGAAVIGVLVEAFAPRGSRRLLQILLSCAALLGALAATVLLAGTDELVFNEAIAIDGPALFLQGTLAVLGLASILLLSERALDSSGGAVVARAAVLPGSREDVALAEATEVQTEIYPLALFSLGGMMLFPAANNLLLMFIALEVLSLPLYLMAGLARRRRLLSQEAAVKYFLLGAFASAFFLYGVALVYGYAGTVDLHEVLRATRSPSRRGAAVRRLRAARGRPAVQGRRGAVPGLDAGRLPGLADAGHRADGGLHQDRRLRCAAARDLRRLRADRVGLAPDDVGPSRSSRWSWARCWRSPRPTSSGCSPTRRSRTPASSSSASSRCPRRAWPAAVLPAGLRLHHARGRSPSSRSCATASGEATAPRAVGRARRQEPASWPRPSPSCLFAPGRHPAHQRLHGQVRRSSPPASRAGRHRAGRRGRRDQRDHGVLLRSRHRADVLQRARRRRARPSPCRAATPLGASRSAWRSPSCSGVLPQPVLDLADTRPGSSPSGPRRRSVRRCRAALSQDVKGGLEDVERRLREVVVSAHPMLTETSRHLVEAGRASASGRCSRCSPPSSATRPAPGVLDAAVVVELTHLASLYHDDVMDEADVRRGAPSANTRWTNTVAILTGDYLFARASDLTAGLGTEATHLQSRTFARLVEGQIAETAGPADGQDAVEHHLQVLADKTGALIATSARLGAMMAGATDEAVDTVTRYGEVIGLAFQLSDDLIDVRSETGQSGKTPGTDLREGIRTLPVLLVLASPDRSPDSERLRELLTGDLADDERLAEALRLLRAHPALDAGPARLAAASTRPVGRRRAARGAGARRARVADRLRPGPHRLSRGAHRPTLPSALVLDRGRRYA
jgi:heptaprenyl diphosphate synthase